MALCLHSLSLLAPWSILYHATYKNTLYQPKESSPLWEIFLPGVRLGQSLTCLAITFWALCTFPSLWQPLTHIAPSFLLHTWGSFYTCFAIISPFSLLIPKMIFFIVEQQICQMNKNLEEEDLPLFSFSFIKKHTLMIPALLTLAITETIDPVEQTDLEDSYAYDAQDIYNTYFGYWDSMITIISIALSVGTYGLFSIGSCLYLLHGIASIIFTTLFPLLLFYRRPGNFDKYMFYIPLMNICLASLACVEFTLFSYYPVPQKLPAVIQATVRAWFIIEIIMQLATAAISLIQHITHAINRKRIKQLNVSTEST